MTKYFFISYAIHHEGSIGFLSMFDEIRGLYFDPFYFIDRMIELYGFDEVCVLSYIEITKEHYIYMQRRQDEDKDN